MLWEILGWSVSVNRQAGMIGLEICCLPLKPAVWIVFSRSHYFRRVGFGQNPWEAIRIYLMLNQVTVSRVSV